MIEEEAITAVLEGKIDFLRQINLRPFINDAGLLSLACAKGHLEMVKLLLNVDGIDVNKNNPLCRACDRGHLKIVELLLNVDGIDVNQSYWPPLCIACEKGHSEIVQLLLACDGIDVNKNSPLSIACSKGYAEIVELFVNINGVDWKKNLLQIAGGKNYLSITKLLVGQPKQATDDKIKIYKEKVSAKERFKKLKRINVNNLRRLRENADTIKTLKQKNERLEKHITDYTRFPLIKQVRISKSSQSIYALKKELNRIEKEISEISTCEKIVEPTDLNQLIEERNNIIDLIIQNYSGKLNEFQKEKEELSDMVKSMESSIRENETYIEYFQNINKLKLKKKDLLKSLTEIKEEIEDIELEKDEISLEIKKQRKNKIANMQDSIERLEKKLSNMGEKISNLNSKKSTIQQELMELIPSFPEIILEMEQTLTGDGTVSTIQEKFRMFALQNSILLLNTKFSDYNIIETVHTGLSDIYKAKKCNNQVVILKEVSLSQSTCDTIMNEIMNIVRLKGHSRIIKLNGLH